MAEYGLVYPAIIQDPTKYI
jgi:hypothetical protein